MENTIRADLEWRLHLPSGVTLTEGLVKYIHEQGPAETVFELVLATQAVAEYVCKRLDLPVDVVRRDPAKAVNRILWKMGFDPPQYTEFSERFVTHLERFNEVLLNMPSVSTEDNREAIRASGVNLFVYVEQFLDMLVSYNLWLLASDHFLGTHFIYDLARARETVAETLGSSLKSDDTTISWNGTGENSLGVLLRYLAETLTWMKDSETRDRDPYRRPDSDLPHYVKIVQARFAFRHSQLWADSDSRELRVYLDGFASIATLIQQANLAQVRNGLDHMRDELRFPGIDTMLASISRLREAHNLAVVKRYIPEIYWLEKFEQSRFGVFDSYLRDAKNRLVILHGPAMVLNQRNLDFEDAYVIAPGNLLGGANSSLVFGIREVGEYHNYWRDYPRRRHIPSHVEGFSSTVDTELPQQMSGDPPNGKTESATDSVTNTDQ